MANSSFSIHKVKCHVVLSDIDECSGALSPCAQTCSDTDGSFNCSCRSGFSFVSNSQCDGKQYDKLKYFKQNSRHLPVS